MMIRLRTAEEQLPHLLFGPSPQPSPRSTGARELFFVRASLVLMAMGVAMMTRAQVQAQDTAKRSSLGASAADKLVLAAPVRSWDEALPLGNGLLGGLLWGEAGTLRLSLDRGDLWDERPHAEPGWWKKRTWKVGGDWDGPYAGATPTIFSGSTTASAP